MVEGPVVQAERMTLEAVRDHCFEALTIESVNWALGGASRTERQQLIAAIGLKLDARFVKRGLGPLVQARLSQVRAGNRWKVADVLHRRCLKEFSIALGNAFDDP